MDNLEREGLVVLRQMLVQNALSVINSGKDEDPTLRRLWEDGRKVGQIDERLKA